MHTNLTKWFLNIKSKIYKIIRKIYKSTVTDGAHFSDSLIPQEEKYEFRYPEKNSYQDLQTIIKIYKN